ncbi:MAG: CoA transferase [Variibacter sp.]|nr:CoA transferase [Variibacter sp.]
MSALAADLARAAWAALGGDAADADAVTFTGTGALPSTFAVTDAASAAAASVGLAAAALMRGRGAPAPAVGVDRRLASFWCGYSIRPVGWSMPPAWDALAGDYRTRDGWIRLHTNAPHHRAVAERVLGAREREAVAAAVARCDADALEAAIVQAGGCAAAMRSFADWAAHPQGRAVAAEPLVHWRWERERAPGSNARAAPSRPLAGVRVLDLTRVLAGPVASRLLAGLGADVLRIDPPAWSEPAIEPEVTLGKHCARLDLHAADDRATFEALLAGADVFLNGYRPDALERLGYGTAWRRARAPGLIDVCLDAYGWTGPWAGRRGFDSLVQMSAGIAEAGMRWQRADKPVPLPVQAVDHITGMLMAAAALRGLAARERTGCGVSARLSLARTAKFLADAGKGHGGAPLAPATDADCEAALERTAWGDARRLRPPLTIAGAPLSWPLPARRLGSDPARWAE